MVCKGKAEAERASGRPEAVARVYSFSGLQDVLKNPLI